MPRIRSVIVCAEERAKVAIRYGAYPSDVRVAVPCYWCGTTAGFIVWFKLTGRDRFGWVAAGGVEWDHFVPLSKGGANKAENVVLACRHCNRSRCNRSEPSSPPPGNRC